MSKKNFTANGPLHRTPNLFKNYYTVKHRSSQFVRVVKESDLKSGGLCPRRGVSSAVEQLTADQ
ncbi:hypothetical protein H8356DRAFT_1337205 [Neocallimastix lanati (nom. inval.)]|nr:hypothetical protein H8356DRAFT_1337205 [Neocallimastix sp. JGI-2020a]